MGPTRVMCRVPAVPTMHHACRTRARVCASPCPPETEIGACITHVPVRIATQVIHQPSIEIFEQFTSLVLLQRGGLLTYFGPLGFESCDLIAYLEAQPGVHTISPGYNPATCE